MIANTFIDNAKVMSKGQVTIPKDSPLASIFMGEE